jgi:hypothetical protein
LVDDGKEESLSLAKVAKSKSKEAKSEPKGKTSATKSMIIFYVLIASLEMTKARAKN